MKSHVIKNRLREVKGLRAGAVRIPAAKGVTALRRRRVRLRRRLTDVHNDAGDLSTAVTVKAHGITATNGCNRHAVGLRAGIALPIGHRHSDRVNARRRGGAVDIVECRVVRQPVRQALYLVGIGVRATFRVDMAPVLFAHSAILELGNDLRESDGVWLNLYVLIGGVLATHVVRTVPFLRVCCGSRLTHGDVGLHIRAEIGIMAISAGIARRLHGAAAQDNVITHNTPARPSAAARRGQSTAVYRQAACR